MPRQNNIWRDDLTEEEKHKAEEKLREWIKNLHKED